MKDEFVIPLDGRSGRSLVLSRHLGKEFFEEFGCSDIIGSDVKADFYVDKAGRYIGVDCVLEGSLTVPCDRCMEALELPVSRTVKLSVKFGKEPAENAGGSEEGEREIVYLPDGESAIDMAQTVYDYCMLSLPLKRVHPDGGCNPVVLRYLVSEMPDEEGSSVREAGDNPFAALKGLFDN